MPIKKLVSKNHSQKVSVMQYGHDVASDGQDNPEDPITGS